MYLAQRPITMLHGDPCCSKNVYFKPSDRIYLLLSSVIIIRRRSYSQPRTLGHVGFNIHVEALEEHHAEHHEHDKIWVEGFERKRRKKKVEGSFVAYKIFVRDRFLLIPYDGIPRCFLKVLDWTPCHPPTHLTSQKSSWQ